RHTDAATPGTYQRKAHRPLRVARDQVRADRRRGSLIICLEARYHVAHGALRVPSVDVDDLTTSKPGSVERYRGPRESTIGAGLDNWRIRQDGEVDRVGSTTLFTHEDESLLPLDLERHDESGHILERAFCIGVDHGQWLAHHAVQEDKDALAWT